MCSVGLLYYAQAAFRACLQTCVRVHAAQRLGFTGYTLLCCAFSAGSLVVCVIEVSFLQSMAVVVHYEKLLKPIKEQSNWILCTSLKHG